MQINIKATNMDLTEAIRGYVDEKVNMLEKVLDNPENTVAHVEVGRTTEGQNKGDIFRAEIRLVVEGKTFYAAKEEFDLYAAIDLVKDDIMREVRRDKNKSQDLFRRGARSLKKRIKGFKPWPFK